jgi:alanyl-tRNA synthetase
VRNTSEIGLLVLVSETGVASGVRRIEALTGPAAVATLRDSDASARAAAALLRTDVAGLPEAVSALRDRAKQAATSSANGAAAVDTDALAATATKIAGADVVAAVVSGPGAKELMDVADRVKGKLGEESATVLGTVVDGRVHLVAAVTPALVARGVRAGAVVKAAAQVAGGGGGGRDTMPQAGGRDPDKLPEAIAAARAAIEAALAE